MKIKILFIILIASIVLSGCLQQKNNTPESKTIILPGKLIIIQDAPTTDEQRQAEYRLVEKYGLTVPEYIQQQQTVSVDKETIANLEKVGWITVISGIMSSEVYRTMVIESIESLQCKKEIIPPKKNITQSSIETIINNSLNYIGLKSYTHEELVNRIELINPGYDCNTIRKELFKTDDTILKYIKSIEVHNSDEIYCNGVKAIGCSYNYQPPSLASSKIDVVYSTVWLQRNSNVIICSSFEHTLNHEIGHTYGSTISTSTGSSEAFAEDYANKQTTAYKYC